MGGGDLLVGDKAKQIESQETETKEKSKEDGTVNRSVEIL